MKKRVAIALISLALMCQALAVRAATADSQQQQNHPAPTGLALEVTYYKDRPPAYATVPGPDSKPNGAWYALFRRVPSWQPPTEALPVRAVNVISRLEGETVRIVVSVYLGVQLFEKEQAVATYRVLENEKITVEGLSRFGVEPFEIRVVRVNPLAASPPSIVNRTESIEVVGLKVNNSTFPSYTVTLRNISGKNVDALGVKVFADGRQNGISLPFGKRGECLIAAGATQDIFVLGAKTARATPEGYSPDSPSHQEILIHTAVFDDGSYEGETKTAADFRAFKAGSKIQVARLLALLEEALDSSEPNVMAALERLKAKAASLSTTVETATLKDLLKEFPSFNKEEAAGLKQAVAVSLAGDRLEFIKRIGEFEKASAQADDPQAFRAWLSSTKEMYEQWLSRLRA
jgi:hypothetical protein